MRKQKKSPSLKLPAAFAVAAVVGAALVACGDDTSPEPQPDAGIGGQGGTGGMATSSTSSEGGAVA